jgi:hypothetical protein
MWQMAELDGMTLMMAIQAVRDQIARYESLLDSETLRDRDEIELLILSYQKTQTRLREAYERDWTPTSNLPAYSKLVPHDTDWALELTREFSEQLAQGRHQLGVHALFGHERIGFCVACDLEHRHFVRA